MGLGDNKTLEDKLAGETLYAFGGFFKNPGVLMIFSGVD
jgi:hypothetical protein